MQKRFKKGFDEDPQGSSEGSSSSENDEVPVKEPAKDVKQPSKKAKTGPQLEDLQELGFRTGPSILTIKEQPPNSAFEWGQGGVQQDESDEEDFDERERTRAAATHGPETAILKAEANKRKLAEELHRERAEYAEKQQQRRESYQQKEKRKRDIGQAKKQKNYVEEEKRLLRQHNVYSGFDN